MSLDFAVDLPNIKSSQTRQYIVINRLDSLLHDHASRLFIVGNESVLQFADSATVAIGSIKSCILDIMLEGAESWRMLLSLMQVHGYEMTLSPKTPGSTGLDITIKTPHGTMVLSLIPNM